MKEKNKIFIKRKIIRIIITISLFIGICSFFANVVFSDDTYKVHALDEDNDSTLINTVNDGNIKYTQFINQNRNDIIKDYYKSFTVSEYFTSNQDLKNDVKYLNYDEDTLKIESGQTIDIVLNAENSGLYTMLFDYYLPQDTIIDTEVSMKINGDTQYYECNQLIFSAEYITNSKEFATDRYGNEIIPTSTRANKWYLQKPLVDGSSLNEGALCIKLEKGKNEISIKVKTGSIVIGNIYLSSKEEYISYQDYLLKYRNANYYIGNVIDLGAEIIDSKSNLNIRIYSLQDPSASRYTTKNKLLNAIYKDSWKTGNQKITWKVSVPSDGLYTLSFKYLQDAYIHMPVQRTIFINGIVPYQDLYAYKFYYTKKWKNETLHNENGPLYVFLKKGENDISMEVNMDINRYAIEQIDLIMDEMSDMSLKIKYLTNGQSDSYRKWQITDQIPNLESELLRWADELDGIRTYLKQYSDNDKYSSTFSNLKLASKKLIKLSKEPNQIPNRMTSFTEGSSSVSQLLGDMILTLNSSPMGIERIYLAEENSKLPKPKSNIFKRIFEGVKRFVLSFFQKEYSVGKANDDEIEVWVNRSRQFVEIMQQMADEEGLKVKFSIMPDQNKLVLANASGDLPDVAMGISNWIPYDLALRGITTDLRQFKGYEELVNKFATGALIPYAYGDGMYGIPETQDFWVTFYRSDIYDSINLNAPSTWDDLLGQLPILQRLGYNFYSPLSSYRGLKPYVATLSYLYQFGASGKYDNDFTGSLYSIDGMSTTLADESFIEALKFMTDLFTIYDIPEETLSFYNSFRYGTLPIGIANSATYTQLLIAAPEIQGNWSLSPHIGTINQDNTINRYSVAGSQGITMFESSLKKEQSWEFITWWMSSKTQMQYIQKLYSMYGLEYLWYSANLEAFATLPIDYNHKEVMLEQLNWAMDASRVPAAYMLERSISDAYSKVVYNGTNVRIALDDAVIESNREIIRKMTEFKYIQNDVKVKDYIVPTIYNINNWLKERESGE